MPVETEVNDGVEAVELNDTDSGPGPSGTGVFDIMKELAENKEIDSGPGPKGTVEMDETGGVVEVDQVILGPGPSGSGTEVVVSEGLTIIIDVAVVGRAAELSGITVIRTVVAEVASTRVFVEKSVSVTGGILLGATVTVLVAPEFSVTVSITVVGEAWLVVEALPSTGTTE